MPATSSTESNSSFAYAPGDLIASKYLLERQLGEGGMGAVFQARNTSLDMLVAIKLLRADMNRGLLAGRLLQEARAAAKLSHPAIVRVFDVGQTALGDPFIVMELLEGETLSQLIDRERGLNPIRAVQLLLPLADALAAAHGKGLVHRDFKPDNVLLVAGDDGTVQPKLLDFGIVKAAQHDGAAGPSDAGTVVGSPDYMSPEQARGLEQVDARSDLWSFSVVLYEVIAGVPPFHASDYVTLLRSIVQDQPKSLKERGAADHALSYIVSRGLNKDPFARFDSLHHMGKALAAWLADQGITQDAAGVSIDTKWLARNTDPPELGRKSWPPPRAEQISGVRTLDVSIPPALPLRATVATQPPSSLAPIAESTRAPARATRWPLLAMVAALVLALPALWLALRKPASDSPVRAATPPPSATPVSPAPAPPPAPVAIASTVAAAPPSASAASEGAPVAPTASAPKSGPQRRTPSRARPLTSAPKKEERLSDKLLAPMTF